jgi:hypothetical protein
VSILDEGISASAIQSGLDGIYSAFIWILILIILGVLLYIIIELTQYKISFRIRETTNGFTVIKDTKIRERKDKDGVRYWEVRGSMFKKPERIPIPEDRVISVTSSGKKVVEAWRLPTGEYQFVVDNGHKLKEFTPFTVNQRLMYIDELKKANEYGKTQWANYVPIIASGMVLVVIFVVALTFWGDVVQPAQELQATNLEIAKQQKITVETLQELIQNKQIFREEVKPE